MLMANKTVTNLVDIAKILTCILNENDGKKIESEIQLADDLIMKASYEFEMVDYRLVGPATGLNDTINSIKIDLIRGNEQIYTITINDIEKEACPDELCNKSMPLDIKIEWLKILKPKMSDGIRFFNVALSKEEEFVISSKAEELRNVLSQMMPQKGRNGR